MSCSIIFRPVPNSIAYRELEVNACPRFCFTKRFWKAKSEHVRIKFQNEL